ncbi:hypothetical protein WP50_35740 [Lactiplantibacillus plantarum]|nr:hypothetical protein WP50_35740 [Lactiplantibacillus plantarum]
MYFVGTENFKALEATVMNLDKQAVDPKVAGQTPWQIAQWAGFDVPSDTKVLAVELPSIGGDQVLSREKLSPVLAVVHAKDIQLVNRHSVLALVTCHASSSKPQTFNRQSVMSSLPSHSTTA